MSDECVTCHRVMKIQARGMCATCYRHQRFVESPAYAARRRAQNREAKRTRRATDDAWREQERAKDRARAPRIQATNCTLCSAFGVVAKGLCGRCYGRTKAQEYRATGTGGTVAAYERKLEHARRNRALIAEAKAQPCVDCGGTFPLCAMDFDHVRGKKLFGLSNAVDRTTASVLAEIAKCDLVCSNCHRVRTCERRTDRARCQVSHSSSPPRC